MPRGIQASTSRTTRGRGTRRSKKGHTKRGGRRGSGLPHLPTKDLGSLHEDGHGDAASAAPLPPIARQSQLGKGSVVAGRGLPLHTIGHGQLGGGGGAARARQSTDLTDALSTKALSHLRR